jgi:hypothetical protein
MYEIETSVFLAQHEEMQAAAMNIVAALRNEFANTSSHLRVFVCEDPEGGDDSLVFEIATTMPGKEARAKLWDFAEDRLPSSVTGHRDRFVFSMNARKSLA